MMPNVVEQIEMKNLKDYIKVKQAAKFLGVSAETLRRWDNSDKLKSYRHPLNKYRLYLKKDLEAILKNIKQK